MRRPRISRVLLPSAAALLLAAGGRGVARGAPPSPPPWAAQADALLEGVREIAAPGALPGVVVAFGTASFPLVLGGAGGARRAPLAGAATWGRGRVVALAHGAFVTSGAARVADTARFLENAVRWTAGRAERPRVLVVGSDLDDVLRARGLSARRAPRRAIPGPIADAEVVVLGEGSLASQEQERLARFVEGGGGLVVGLCPWGWLQATGAQGLEENGIQRLLAPAGLAFSQDTVERTGGTGYLVHGAPGTPFHAREALDLVARSDGRAPGLDRVQAALVARQAVGALPPDEDHLRPRIAALLRSHAHDLVPTPARPLGADRPLERLLLAAQAEEAAWAPPGKVRAHPAATSFPGAPASGARPVERRFDLDLAVPGWTSTGLYAVAGEVVRVVWTDEAPSPGLAVRIGCHTDTLWHLDAWPRAPSLSCQRALGPGTTEIASPFGGLVYLVVPPGRSGRLVATVAGAVEAPLYVRGETSKEAWAKARRAPGPWAELATRKVVLTVPSQAVRGLEDPEPLLALWDRFLDAAADLAGAPRERVRPERYVADVEISAGYMHSGYPIMTHLDAVPRMLDARLLASEGDWGLFHELGHNHQEDAWTFDGTVEVTCNLFTLYLLEQVCGRRGVEGHPALEGREAKAQAHLAAGAPFAAWKADPFLALTTYVHLLEAFGWAPFREVFAQVRALPASDRPATDEAKRDVWMVRFSRAVGRDLGPFFTAWGVPTSEGARTSLADLPAWMPPGFPR